MLLTPAEDMPLILKLVVAVLHDLFFLLSAALSRMVFPPLKSLWSHSLEDWMMLALLLAFSLSLMIWGLA
jgi:hypothetical protein